MGGKRPDQYQIDPDEAGATDHKNRPDTPNEARPDKELYGRVMKGEDGVAHEEAPETSTPPDTPKE